MQLPERVHTVHPSPQKANSEMYGLKGGCRCSYFEQSCKLDNSHKVFSQGWDPIGADITMFIVEHIFLQLLPNPRPAALYWYPRCMQRHSPKTSAVDGIWCSFWVHAGRCKPAVRGFFARLRGSCQLPAPTVLPYSVLFCEPQVFLWCVRGGNSTLREFISRHGMCLLPKQATCTVRNGRKSQTYSQTLGDPNSPLQRPSRYTPHTPPTPTPPPKANNQIPRPCAKPHPSPEGHSMGTNETTVARTTKNAPCWHKRCRPPRDMYFCPCFCSFLPKS